MELKIINVESKRLNTHNLVKKSYLTSSVAEKKNVSDLDVQHKSGLL